MRKISWTGVTLTGLLALASAVGGAESGEPESLDQGRPARVCSAATLRGVYGIQMQGTRPSGPGGGVETVIGVIWRAYDGRGSFRQVDNVKGSQSGIVFDRSGFGTYTINEDCTGETSFEPGPGVVLLEKLVVVDGGREVLSIVTSPQPVMVSSVQKRIGRASGW